MRILLTGSSGFLGKIITEELASNQIFNLARHNAAINVDLSSAVPELPGTDLVIHAAGKAHVMSVNAKDSLDFDAVNVKGTVNLLSALEHAKPLPKAFVFISSVAVYGRKSGVNISEEDQLAATDPYGLSKIKAELIVQEWCERNKVICTILRLPLLVGPNAPGNLGKMETAIKKGVYVNIMGGRAKKSMVLAKDVANVIIHASTVGGTYNLTDGYHPTFFELSKSIAGKYSKSTPFSLPKWFVLPLAKLGDLIGPKFPFNSKTLDKIISDLTFNDEKARKALNWNPEPVIESLNNLAN